MPTIYEEIPLIKISIIFIVSIYFTESLCSYFDLAKDTLSKGDVVGTIRVYEEAIMKDPKTNCLAYYLLGNIHLSRGKLNEAIKQYGNYINHQCEKVNIVDVLSKEIRAHIRFGHMEKAREILDKNKALFEKEPNNLMNTLYNEIAKLEQDISNLDRYVNDKHCNEALQLNEQLRTFLTHSNRLLKYKIQCYNILNDINGLISTLKIYIKMNTDDIGSMLQLSQTYFSICNLDESLEYVRACLRSDQGNNDCLKHMRNVKSYKRMIDNIQSNLDNKNYKNMIKLIPPFLTKAISSSSDGISCLESKALYYNCHAYSRLKENPTKALEICSNALDKSSNDIQQKSDILLSRGLIYIDLDQLDKAKNDIFESLKLHETKEGEDAKVIVERLIKKRDKRDYYKILGVSKTAKDSEIKNAYRKLAVTSHPDKAKTSEEKEILEKKFIDINHAREVLLDKEKRAQFDRGIDPLDVNDNNIENTRNNPFQNRRSNGGGGSSFFSSDRNFFDFTGGHFTFHF